MTNTDKVANRKADATKEKEWQSAIFEKLANRGNPLSGVISDEAYREIMRTQVEAIKRSARVAIADLDGADGTFDGVIHKDTLQRKAGKLAETFGFSKEALEARLKDLPDTLSAAELNASVDRVFKGRFEAKPEIQNGLPPVIKPESAVAK